VQFAKIRMTSAFDENIPLGESSNNGVFTEKISEILRFDGFRPALILDILWQTEGIFSTTAIRFPCEFFLQTRINSGFENLCILDIIFQGSSHSQFFFLDEMSLCPVID
jgi:hypothetical protein